MQIIYNDDVNIDYDAFVNLLTSLYCKNCKLTKIEGNIKTIINNKPWMTNGIKMPART